MANTITGDRWVLDTPNPEANVTDRRLYISVLEFVPAAGDQACVIQDGAGHELWSIRSIAGSPNNESVGIERWQNPTPAQPVDGLRLHTLDGGRLIVHLH